MAIETRVHNLWVGRTCSFRSLIWDTGEYEVLPNKDSPKQDTTDNELSDNGKTLPTEVKSDSERLFAAFQRHHIRLRLHGTRLPPDYALSLRLPSNNYSNNNPRPPSRKRRRADPAKSAKASKADDSTDSEADALPTLEPSEAGLSGDGEDIGAAPNDDNEDEDASIRVNNAYPGATNAIGSVHQRHWLLVLDRGRSGFRKALKGPDKGRWVNTQLEGWEAFIVRGRDVERSVVTGRLAEEVIEDDGVEKFVGRKRWRAITE